jgi:glycosyltransferase involved in cell wall biosynthesis
MSKLTVLMPVYNGLPYVREAIDSVLRQTLTDFTLLVIDDGSKDGSSDYLDSLTDPRVRVVHQPNQGLAGALNNGIALCESEYLARMDADDVMLPTRLATQLAFLESRPKVGLVGAQVAPLFNGRAGGGVALPLDHQTIDDRLMQGRHAICHSSIMCRTALMREIGGYWPKGVSEDWDMYLRMSERAQLANVNEVLLHVRVVETGIQSRQMNEVRARIAYACDAARRRRRGAATIAYEDFCQLRQQTPWWRKASERLETYAMVQYRKSQPEILGAAPLTGYARLAWAAACSPKLTWQRINRVVRHRLLSPANGS